MTQEPVKFLIVDDIEQNLIALEALLRRDGLEIVRAHSGPEALEQLLVHDFALALLDVQMPGMDGFELASLMRGTERTRRIPIVFLTAGGVDEQRRAQGYGTGAVDFLFKPIEPAILKSKADVFFDLYAQRQEAVRQRDELRIAAARNASLLAEVNRLNAGLEKRVEERTGQLLEANEQLQGFTYSVAHDFRQHIRGISINASILLSEASENLGEYQENAERIRNVAHLMGQMSEDLLMNARLGREEMRVVEIDVSSLARTVAEARAPFYPGTECKVQPGLVARGDRTMVRILIDNLVDNAFKYSQFVDHPRVEVGRDEESFFVRDNGVGFDMAHAGKLFGAFERLHRGDKFGGTGIGLANVERIVRRHGGSVWADSAPGRGSTFRFMLQTRGQESRSEATGAGSREG